VVQAGDRRPAFDSLEKTMDLIADIPDQLLGYLSYQLSEMPLVVPVTAENRDAVRGQIRAAFVQLSTEVEQRTEALMERWIAVTIDAATRMPALDGLYVSEWDDDITVKVACKWNPELRVAFDFGTVNVDGLDSCQREYVLLPNGVEIDLASDQETPDGIPAVAESAVPEIGDIVHHLDSAMQPTTEKSLITAIGAAALHGGICMVYTHQHLPLHVIRARDRDRSEGGARVWLEYQPGD